MSALNKAQIIGNLGADPDVRYMASGDAVANLRIATSETWKDKDSGEKRENTEWHKVVLFGKVAEIAQQYLRKGSKIYIEGKLKTRKYQKEGVDHYSTEIVVNGFGGQMIMLGEKGGGSRQQGGQQASRPPANARQQAEYDGPPDFDDDIPF